MVVEQIIEKMEEHENIIFRAMKEMQKLLEELKNADAEKYDWVSVAEGARILKVSLATVYRFINIGKIQKIKHIGAKIFLSKNELMAIDDKYIA